MFKDSTKTLLKLTRNTDSFLYLGAEYMSSIRSLKKGAVHQKQKKTQKNHTHKCHTFVEPQIQSYGYDSTEITSASTSSAIKWCNVGTAETKKCDTWSINSMEGDVSTIECENAPTVEECLKKIMVRHSWMKIQNSPGTSFASCLFLTESRLNHPAAQRG